MYAKCKAPSSRETNNIEQMELGRCRLCYAASAARKFWAKVAKFLKTQKIYIKAALNELIHKAKSGRPNNYKTRRMNLWQDGQIIKNWKAKFDHKAEYIYRVGIIVLQYSVVRLNSAVQFYLFSHLVKYSVIRLSIYSAVWIRPYGQVRFECTSSSKIPRIWQNWE